MTSIYVNQTFLVNAVFRLIFTATSRFHLCFIHTFRVSFPSFCPSSVYDIYLLTAILLFYEPALFSLETSFQFQAIRSMWSVEESELICLHQCITFKFKIHSNHQTILHQPRSMI